MKTLALYNLKGGVGKSATAVNLAFLAARAGVPTLLWDLDPQGAATWYLGIDSGFESSAKKLLQGKSPLGREVRPTVYSGLEVLPADGAFRDVDIRLHKTSDGRRVLRDLVEPLGETNGLLLLDCPPSLSRLSENVVRASSCVLSPIIPTPLSLRAWEQIRTHFGARKYGRKKLLPFFSMVDRRRRLHREWTDRPPSELSEVLRSWVPYSSEVERMGIHRAPIETFAPRTAVARAYRQLWREVAERAGIG